MNGIILEMLLEKPELVQQPAIQISSKGPGLYALDEEGLFAPWEPTFGEQEFARLGDALVAAGERANLREANGWLIDQTQFIPGDR
jgi:hypothetical protein